jgi:type IV secretion system protein VirB9
MKTKAAAIFFLLLVVANLPAQPSARTVHYHASDIVPIRAKMRYTTLIQLPASEKILEVATGDKDFWITDVINNLCFLHPAKADIHSNLNLITDKANVYSFTLDDVESGDPDLKIVILPSDLPSVDIASGLSKLVPAAEVAAAQQSAQGAEDRARQAVEQFRSEYPTQQIKFDYVYRNKKPFAVVAIYQDGQFTYVRTSAAEKFSVYELKDGRPDLVAFQLDSGTYVLPKVVDHGYLAIGKLKLNFDRVTR